jgi:acyl-phosphate glycerol 3-phosphate acyltransferase
VTFSLFSAVLLSFLLGSIPFGWIIAKLWGVSDLRTEGSKNVGATNVVRTAGWIPGALTFLLDFAKGAVPVYFFLCDNTQLCTQTNVVQGFAAIMGHCFSPFLYFRGGKGVSTILGMIVVLQPWIGLVSIVCYLLGLGFLRVSAMGSLFAMGTILLGELLFGQILIEKFLVIVAVLLVLHRHRVNWDQLLKASAIVLMVAGLRAVAVPAVHAVEHVYASAAATSSSPSSSGSAMVVEDFRRKKVRLAGAPQKVVALMPALAEAVFDMGFGSSVIAVPEYTNIPDQFKASVKNVGPYPRLSAEVIHALRPDVILASMDGNESTVIRKLEALGNKVVVVNTNSVVEILRTLKLVAKIFHAETNAKLALFEKTFTKSPTLTADATVAKPKIFLQVGWDPLISVGKQTYLDELIVLAGGENIFADSGMKYPRPSAEAVIKANPDIIVICQLTDTGAEEQRASDFWKRFSKMKAVTGNKVFIIRGDILTKPGFSLTEGLAELKKVIGQASVKSAAL